MTTPAVRLTNPRTDVSVVKTYVELMKLRIIELLLVTTLPAMVAAAGGWPGWWLVLATLVGGTLSAAGANAINQAIDHDIDRLMSRTRGRPLPTERVSKQAVVVFGVGLGIAGFVWLWASTNLLAASLSTVGLLFYVFVYSLLLKRHTTQNIVIGGAAGAMPVLVGWAAVTDTVALPAWIMFAIVFFWTPPHFWALAIRYHKDYERAGVVSDGQRPEAGARSHGGVHRCARWRLTVALCHRSGGLDLPSRRGRRRHRVPYRYMDAA